MPVANFGTGTNCASTLEVRSVFQGVAEMKGETGTTRERYTRPRPMRRVQRTFEGVESGTPVTEAE